MRLLHRADHVCTDRGRPALGLHAKRSHRSAVGGGRKAGPQHLAASTCSGVQQQGSPGKAGLSDPNPTFTPFSLWRLHHLWRKPPQKSLGCPTRHQCSDGFGKAEGCCPAVTSGHAQPTGLDTLCCCTTYHPFQMQSTTCSSSEERGKDKGTVNTHHSQHNSLNNPAIIILSDKS